MRLSSRGFRINGLVFWERFDILTPYIFIGRGRQVRVNAVEPGFAAGSTASPLTDAHVQETTAGIPLGRASAPGDAAGALLYLCSAAASYGTGTSIAVDGGNSIGSLVVHQEKKHPL